MARMKERGHGARRLGQALLRLFLLAVAAGALALALRGADLSKALAAVRGADWRLIALAAAINVPLIAAARTGRFATLLRGLPHKGPKATFFELWRLLLAARAVSLALPGGRAGDLLRATMLRRRHGYAWDALAASHLAEPAIEALSLAVPALALLILARPPQVLSAGLLAMGILGLGAAGLGFYVARSGQRREALAGGGRLSRALITVRDGMRLLEDPRTWALCLLVSLLVDALDAAMIALCAAATGIHLGLSETLMVLVAINIALVLPATPGNLGLLEAGAVIALTALGRPAPLAVAFSGVYHAAHLVPVAIGGGLCLLGLRMRAKSQEAPVEAPVGQTAVAHSGVPGEARPWAPQKP